MIDSTAIGWELVRILADASAKAVVLAVVVGLTLWAGRVRNVAVRHAAWAVVLCGMIVLPLLGPVVPGIVVPLFPASGAGSSRADNPRENRIDQPESPAPRVVIQAASPQEGPATGPLAPTMTPRAPV